MLTKQLSRLIYFNVRLFTSLSIAGYLKSGPLFFFLRGLLLKIKIYRSSAIYVALYGSSIWSLISWRENRMRMFVNNEPRRISVLKDMGNNWIWKIHNEALCVIYACIPHTVFMIIKSRMIQNFGHSAIWGHEKGILNIYRKISEDERASWTWM